MLHNIGANRRYYSLGRLFFLKGHYNHHKEVLANKAHCAALKLPSRTRHHWDVYNTFEDRQLLELKMWIGEIVQKAHAISRCDAQGYGRLGVSVVFS